MKRPQLDALTTHSLLLGGAMLCSHAANILFHGLTGRRLPDADYATWVALFSLLQLTALPAQSYALSVAREVARCPQITRPLLRRECARFLTLTPLLLLLWPLRGFLPLTTPAAWLFVSSTLLLGALLGLAGGILQGQQRFAWLAGRSLLLFPGRFLLVWLLFALLTPSLNAVMAAHALSTLLALGLSGAGIRLPAPAVPLPRLWRPALKIFPALFAFSILLTADVLLARHLFAPSLSSPYARAAVIARMILWLPLPVAQALFPKLLAPAEAASRHQRQALRFTNLLLLSAWLGCLLFAPLGLRILFGAEAADPDTVRWLRTLATALTPLAWIHLHLQQQIATASPLRHQLLLPAFALLFVLLTLCLAQHPDTLILLLGLTNLTAACTLRAFCLRNSARPPS